MVRIMQQVRCVSDKNRVFRKCYSFLHGIYENRLFSRVWPIALKEFRKRKKVEKCVTCDKNWALLTTSFFYFWVNVSAMCLHTQKPKHGPNKISTRRNYKILHKWGSSSNHMWAVKVDSTQQGSHRAPSRLHSLVNECLLIPAVIAKSMFKRGGQKNNSRGRMFARWKRLSRQHSAVNACFPRSPFAHRGCTERICIQGEPPLQYLPNWPDGHSQGMQIYNKSSRKSFEFYNGHVFLL